MKKCDEEAIRRWLVTAILVGSVLTMVTVVASANTIYVPDVYPTIQQAVNNANDGDIIIVRDGTYTENVDVNKRLTIQSENGPANCIVNAADSNDHVFDVTADYVNITGFTVKYATGRWKVGICMNGVNHCNIKNNNLTSNFNGIYISYLSNNNTISYNTVYNNTHDGISMDYWNKNNNNNTISYNTVYNNTCSGIYMPYASNNNVYNNNIYYNDYGIFMQYANTNTIYNNNIYNNTHDGIYMYYSSNNNISCNRIQNNSARGFYLIGGSTGNTIVYNNIIMNGVYNPSTGGYEYQFYNAQSYDVEATHNFWGYGMTNDKIDASIYDDEEGGGEVTFLPKLDEPGPCPPVPELPTVVLTILGLVSLTGYVELRKRNKE